MYSTPYLFRLTKIIIVAAIALLAVLIVVGNTTDYYTNYHFVEHVLNMDTTFPNSEIRYRRITNPTLFHMAYLFIIALEALMAFCCLKGTWLLLKHLNRSSEAFHAAKNWAVAGILIGLMIWFLGFEVIGGEWFAMWQSSQWNGLSSAERIVSFLGIALVLLQLKEE